MSHRRLSAAALCALFAGACSAAPPSAPPHPAPPPGQPAVVAAPLLPPARWIVSREKNTSEPFAGGTVMLVGGRRLRIGKDGSARWQTAELPLPLDRIAVVPTAAGPRLVGRAEDIVYRFDDPLGEGTPLLGGGPPVELLRAMPGFAVVWAGERFSPPRFLAVESGKESVPTTLLDFPLKDVVFTDDRHGAAIFGLWGLQVTHDGGATWQRPRTAGPPADVLDVEDFANLDLVAGHLGDRFSPQAQPEPGAPPATEPELGPGMPVALDKLVSSRGDPLAQAVVAGVAAPDGGAWIEWGGLIVKIDLRATAATVVARIPGVDAKSTSWCKLLRAGSHLWIGCKPLSTDRSLTVVRATPKDATLLFGAPEQIDLVDSELRTSPSGGVLAFEKGNTDTREPPVVRVRQPNGRWLRQELRWGTEPNAGALADGRVAVLDNPRPGKKPPQVLVVTPGTGEVETLPPLDLPALAATGPIEEDADHVLHFIVKDRQGAIAVAQPLGGKEARLTRVPGALAARLQAGRGIAVSKQSVLVSSDSGMTWNEVPAPPRLLKMLSRPEALRFVEGDAASLRMRHLTFLYAMDRTLLTFAAGELGAMVGEHLRLGWGAADAPPAVERAAPVALDRIPPLTGKLHALSCRDDGAAAGALSPGDGTWRSFGKLKLPENMTVEDAAMASEQTLFTPPELPVIGPPKDPFAAPLLYLETAPDEPPQKWLVRWLDPTEIGSRGRGWQGKAPDFSPYATVVRFHHPAPGQTVAMRMPLDNSRVAGLAARDGRAIFFVAGTFHEPHGKDGIDVDAGMLVRVNAGGNGQMVPIIVGNSRPGARTAAFLRGGPLAGIGANGVRILDDRLFFGGPTLSEATFGRGPGAPIAGILANQLFVWFEGKPMQPIARLPDLGGSFPAQIIVGEPTADGVPLLALQGSFQRIGVVPIPKVDAGDPPLLDDVVWKRPPVPLLPERLPPCAAKARGMSFTLRASQPPVRTLLDGVELTPVVATFDLRVSDSEACLVRASVALGAKARPAAEQRFVRADFATRRAEGGALDAPAAKVRKLSCAWIED